MVDKSGPDERSGPVDAIGFFSGYVAEFHAHYGDRPDFAERLAIWGELLDRYAPRHGLAVDMGSGTGIFSFYLAGFGARVIGIDGAADMVGFCEDQRRQRGIENVRFVHARLPDVDHAMLRDADLVISSSVVEYIDARDETLALFARVLKPGGVLIMSMPNAFSVSRAYERLKYQLCGRPAIYRHIRHFTSPTGLQRYVAPHGLALQEARYYAHGTQVARLARRIGLPPRLTEDLFVAIFRKT